MQKQLTISLEYVVVSEASIQGLGRLGLGKAPTRKPCPRGRDDSSSSPKSLQLGLSLMGLRRLLEEKLVPCMAANADPSGVWLLCMQMQHSYKSVCCKAYYKSRQHLAGLYVTVCYTYYIATHRWHHIVIVSLQCMMTCCMHAVHVQCASYTITSCKQFAG